MPTSVVVVVSAPSTGIVGQPYSATMTATGGVPPYHWGAVSALPAWMHATASGATLTLSGTPDFTGPYWPYGLVTDSYFTPQPGSWQVNFTVSFPKITMACHTPPTGTVGQPYSGTVTAAGGDGIPFIWSYDGLPVGLPAGLTGSGSGGTYTISGTPDVAQSYDMYFSVTDDNSSASIDCPVQISP